MITKEQLESLLVSTWLSESNKEILQNEFMAFVNRDSMYMTPELRKFIESHLLICYGLFFRGYLVNKNKIKDLAWEIAKLTQ